MADTKLTALTAASALAGADLFYISQGGVSKKATHTQLLALVGTTYVPLAGGTMTGALTIASGTLTASAPALSITQTWNNAAVAFKAALVNVTKLASDGAGMLQEWQLGGVSRAYVREDGVFYCLSGGYFSTVNLGTGSDGNWTATRIGLRSDSYYGIGDSNNVNSATQDVRLYRDAAATLAQRNGTNAQTFKVYGTTDAGLTNYERLAISAQQGVGFTIAAETLGTGADNLSISIVPSGTGSILIPNEVALRTGYVLGFVRLDFTNVILRRGDGSNAFGMLAFGGITSTDPGLKRTGALLQCRLSDDSSNAGFSALYVLTPAVAFAALVAAATAGAGARAFINDGAGAVFGVAAAGGGALNVPVYSDGTNWLVG